MHCVTTAHFTDCQLRLLAQVTALKEPTAEVLTVYYNECMVWMYVYYILDCFLNPLISCRKAHFIRGTFPTNRAYVPNMAATWPQHAQFSDTHSYSVFIPQSVHSYFMLRILLTQCALIRKPCDIIFPKIPREMLSQAERSGATLNWGIWRPVNLIPVSGLSAA